MTTLGKTTRMLGGRAPNTKREITSRNGGVGDINVRNQRRSTPVPRRGGAGAIAPNTFIEKSYGFTAIATDENLTDFWNAAGARYYHTFQERGEGNGLPQAVGESIFAQWSLVLPVGGPVSFTINLAVDGNETETPQ